MSGIATRGVFHASVFLLSLLSSPLGLSAVEQRTNDPHIILLDRILAKVEPGQKTVLIDDMGFPVSVLRAYRNELAATPPGAW